MVVIRLARAGAKKRAFYNVVVADSRKPATGKFIERVGFYNPKAPEGGEAVRFAADRLSYWTGKGAKMTPTVARLVKSMKAGMAAGAAVPAETAQAPANAA